MRHASFIDLSNPQLPQTALQQREALQKGLTLSTADVLPHERREWLEDMICQEFTRVAVTPPADRQLFNETTLYDWDKLRLSVIHSRGLTIERLRREPYHNNQDNYLAVILLSGRYSLEQNGREVFLQPGDMTIYDATRPHRIQSSIGFSKILVSIPRVMMRDRLAGIEHCTALSVPGKIGVGAMASQFMQTAAIQAKYLRSEELTKLSAQSLDLLTLAFQSVRPQHVYLSRSRSLSLRQIKDYVAQRLKDTQLDTAMIAEGTRLSPRYINDLFSDEETSLMRYVWRSRLEKCRKEILEYPCEPVSVIAFKWGFNDMSHFSRAFKKRFGIGPTELKRYVNETIEPT
ncbi:MAG: helix-turn-helix domain-containing protein [Methylophilus sp.]|nr:helix-turn-helix domain-containing protein [Methylophilus sp.]